MKRLMTISVLLVCLSLNSAASAGLILASWNVRHLGWGDNKSFSALSRVIHQFDFVAVQELMSDNALDRLEQRLEEKTGETWSTLSSDSLGRNSYQEQYAFIWRDSVVEYVEGAVVYMDGNDVFAREPFSARFRAVGTDFDFVVSTVHILFGERISDRTPEIHALRDYWDWLDEVYPETADRRFLVGDFNLDPQHEAWGELSEVAKPLITQGATTLSANDRRYVNLYDNIFVPASHSMIITQAGILRYPELLTETSDSYWSHEKARRHVSDHAPVYVLLNGAVHRGDDAGTLYVPNLDKRDGRSSEVTACVDLDTAPASELERITHIGPERAEDIVAGRPWASVNMLTKISGIGPSRVRDIREQMIVCE